MTTPTDHAMAAKDMDNILLHIYWAIEAGKTEDAKKLIQTHAVDPAVKELVECLDGVIWRIDFGASGTQSMRSFRDESFYIREARKTVAKYTRPAPSA